MGKYEGHPWILCKLYGKGWLFAVKLFGEQEQVGKLNCGCFSHEDKAHITSHDSCNLTNISVSKFSLVVYVKR